MKYISAQPETKYYEWQVNTMIHSYLENGVKQDDIIVLLGHDGSHTFSLQEKYPFVHFHSYNWVNEPYPPAIKPYLMSKFFGGCRCTEGDQYYYADADTILTKPLPYFSRDKVYMSDTRSYIGLKYIRSKGEDILDIMANTAKIDKRILEERDEEAGGAQFVFTGTNAEFWQSVYVLSNALYRAMRDYNNSNKKKYEGDYPIQAWTAEMWATLWMFWRKGYKTRISDDLAFAWSTDPIEMIERTSILHNAGVTDQKNLFRKSEWIHEKPKDDLDITKTHCSYYYYKKVLEATC